MENKTKIYLENNSAMSLANVRVMVEYKPFTRNRKERRRKKCFTTRTQETANTHTTARRRGTYILVIVYLFIEQYIFI